MAQLRTRPVHCQKEVTSLQPRRVQNVTTEFTWELHSLQEHLQVRRTLSSSRIDLQGIDKQPYISTRFIMYEHDNLYKLEMERPKGCELEVDVSLKAEDQTMAVTKVLSHNNERLFDRYDVFDIPHDGAFGRAVKKRNGFLLVARLRILCFQGERVDVVEHSTLEAHSTLGDSLQNAWETGDLSDVTLTSEDGCDFPAHRMLLAMRSPVFRAMFYGGMREARSGVATIKATGTALRELLRCIYTDNVDEDVVPAVAEELLHLGAQYEMTRLVSMTGEVLHRTLGVDNVAFRLSLALRFDLEDLKAACKKLIHSHLDVVMKTDGWRGLCDDSMAMRELMQPDPELRCSSPPKLKRPRRA